MPLIMVPHGYATEGFDFTPHRVARTFAELPAMVLELLDTRNVETPVMPRAAAG